jgi:hypothetical protein
MEKNKENSQGWMNDQQNLGPEGTATHSGWSHFYSSFAKHREECIKLGKNVMGNNLWLAVSALSYYHSSLYSMTQQIFSFYGPETETELTDKWIEIGEKVNDFLGKVSDKDFRNQMAMEGQVSIDKDLKLDLLKYFNKVDRMAAKAGLLVGQENKGVSEPKKGLLGFKER